ncbi:MAG: hypothetical protein K9H25_06565 [Rhodospirillum sp.]|nr:hypothetical protein [Rhodospirillum sp.]MCF8489076.1 hypothetical protein [Rhodospirillum sp.]MCF8502838.1 hypothetical protein [Rhodospirillum sp.]
MNAIIVYPAAYHGETRVVHAGIESQPEAILTKVVTPLTELREASLHMEHALEQVRDVVDRLNADQLRAGERAACLGYLSGTLSDRMGDLCRETENFVSFLRG